MIHSSGYRNSLRVAAAAAAKAAAIMKRAGQVLCERFTVYLGPTPKYKRR
jgi:hypothetical protein